jgi:Sec-independent protein translocase protein TatA
MEILGIGLPELAFIVIIALILLGPKDMVAAGRTFGKTLRKIVTSPTWKAVRMTSQELQQLPTKLIREAGLEEELEKIRDIEKEVLETTATVRVSIDPRLPAPSPEEKQASGASDSPSPAPPAGQDELAPDSSGEDSKA